MLVEVQGLRGIAILAVLLFHLWPSIFPNGYVGVDMFFVISGYLMALIFSRHPSMNIRIIADFYYKRAKRILPLYYLAVPLILLAGHLFLGPAWIDMNNSFALYSLALLKNMKTIWDGSDYFLSFQTAVYKRDLFLHLWSLAVEIQFYLIVPFIFLGLQILGYISKFLREHTFFKPSNLFSQTIFLFILSAAFCTQYYYSNPIFSFNYFLSRMWQFCPGMMAFLATEKKGPEIISEKQVDEGWQQKAAQQIVVILATVPIALLLVPGEVPNEIMRPATTGACFLLLLVGTNLSKKVLTNRWLTYFGDISYSLYLIHWPIIILFKNTHSIQFIIGLTLFLSILSYSFYENFYRRLTIPKIFALLIVLAVFNAAVFLSLMKCPYVIRKLEEHRYPTVKGEAFPALLKNLDFAKHNALAPHAPRNRSSDYIHAGLEGPWGIYDYPAGNGSRKVMVIGNSYTLNQGNVINEEFHGNYSHFKILSGFAFTALYDAWAPPSKYEGQHEAVLRVVEEFRPDILFIVVSMLEPLDLNDPRLSIYKANIHRLMKVCGRILFTGPLPVVSLNHLNSFITTIVENGDLSVYNLDKKKADEQMVNVGPRLTAIGCSTCQMYDVKSEFLNGDRYLTYDQRTNLSFYDNDIHLTLVGLEQIRPAYTKLIATL